MLDPRLAELLCCPCGGDLSQDDARLTCAQCAATYPIRNGIPRFAVLTDEGQNQVRETFGYKWQRGADWGISGETKAIADAWNLKLLGWSDEDAYAAHIRPFRVLLDAGCGNGRELIRLARLNPDALVVGLDISHAIDVAARNATGFSNVVLVQADILNPPLKPSSIGYISSLGVLHHTPSTEQAVAALTTCLIAGGEFAFAVYRRKTPLREFTDDYIREQIRNLSPQQAWQAMESITLLGKALSDLKVEIDVPDVPLLGIVAGRHNLQRMLYYTVLKCYWRDGVSFEDNVHVNFDWYYPQYAWRHTPEEIRGWLSSLLLSEVALIEDDAQYGVRARKPT
jgi:SAM-dependent methyltransferase